MPLAPGAVIAERFEVRDVAGRGGMSIVYRALDRLTGDEVALKVTSCEFDEGLARFAREANVLAELPHPAIVRYIAHGATPTGDHYLAMEWLDGEDLSFVLKRRRLEVDECVLLARRMAEALSFAHRRGVVHRDIKPSNVFLPGGRIEAAKLLDFGVARLRQAIKDLTMTGMALGTPAYMSPEQARGDKDVGPASDVYSLACVLFATLTRRKPFPSDSAQGFLAKAMSAERPRLSSIRSDVPPDLDALVLRMMSIAVEDRPKNGSAVLEAIDSLTPSTRVPSSSLISQASEIVSLTDDEQRLHAVVIASEAHRDAPLLGRVAAQFGGKLEHALGGVSVIRISSRHAATDLAVRAARCALAIRAESPGVPLAVATGRDVARGDEESGTSTIVARASKVLPVASDDLTLPMGASEIPADELARPIGIDDVTAGLLDGRFELARHEGKLVLLPGSGVEPSARTLLGKPTTCVARSAELSMLQALLMACIEDRTPKAALLTAPAGIGKSRLRHELVLRLEQSGTEVQVLSGFGDPLGAGAPFRILAGALRRDAGIKEGEPNEIQAMKLHDRIARDLGDDPELEHVVELVCELIGAPVHDASVQLRAARQDARLMGERIRWATERWLTATCRRMPMLLVLDDLHWGDAPTVAFVDGLLDHLNDCPLFVLGIARPEISELFPNIWEARGVSHIRLAPLSERASRQLIEQVLGKSVPAQHVEAMVRRAAGNVLCLEEMIRATAAGESADLPETVLAIVQARLEKMEPEARRLLRAASVFGRRFWEGGVRALLRDDENDLVSVWLDLLAAEEVVQRHQTSAFEGEAELSFRHDLMRDAAYAMLTDKDRHVGHRLAAAWLEKVGEPEPLVLAQHFERGDQLGRAADYYRAAAEKALATDDFAGVLHSAERAQRLRPGTDGGLLLVQAEASNWHGEFARAASSAMAALKALPAGTEQWFGAVQEVATACGVQGDARSLVDLAKLVERESHELGERGIAAVTRLAEQLVIVGRVDVADTLLARVDRRDDSFDAQNPGIVARVASAKALRACFDGDTAANLELASAAAARFSDAGDLRNACIKRERVGYATMELGAYAEAVDILSSALATAESIGLKNVAATARHNLGLALARLGRFDEALAIEQQAVDAFASSGNRRMEGASREYLAMIRLESGDAEGAETDARRALVLAREPTLLPLNEAESLAILARVLTARGRKDEALLCAEEGLAALEKLGGIDDGESIIRLAYAEALDAAGKYDEAERAYEAARERLMMRADRIAEPKWRRSFLENVPENAQTMGRMTRPE